MQNFRRICTNANLYTNIVFDRCLIPYIFDNSRAMKETSEQEVTLVEKKERERCEILNVERMK